MEFAFIPPPYLTWVSDYSSIMCKFSAKLHIDTCHMWHVDEIHFKVLKKARYLFAVMNSESRFILAYHISKYKQGVKPTRLFRAAAFCSMHPPRILVSDGLRDFCAPTRKIFHRMSGPRFVHMRDTLEKYIQPEQHLRAPQRRIQGQTQMYRGPQVRELGHNIDDYHMPQLFPSTCLT